MVKAVVNKPSASPIPAIHAERRKHPGLAEELDWRDWLERVTGSRSLRDMTLAQQQRALDALRGGGGISTKVGRSRADDPQSRKIRALWLSLYHLGEVRDSSERAIAVFCRRSGSAAEALQWLDAGEKVCAIENLRAWCKRVGFEPPRDPALARRALIRLQWCQLGEVGLVEPHPWALDAYASRVAVGRSDALDQITDQAALDKVIRTLGDKLRAARKRAGGEGVGTS